jgi:hypothetical protein
MFTLSLSLSWLYTPPTLPHPVEANMWYKAAEFNDPPHRYVLIYVPSTYLITLLHIYSNLIIYLYTIFTYYIQYYILLSFYLLLPCFIFTYLTTNWLTVLHTRTLLHIITFLLTLTLQHSLSLLHTRTLFHSQQLAQYQLNVPAAAGGRLAFKDVCGDYLRKGDKK